MPRRSPAHRAAVGAALALAVALAGCAAPAEPASEPTPTKTAVAPIFTSDEEALAAVDAALTRFFDVVGDVGEDGGDDAERVLSVTTGPAADEHLEYLQTLSAEQLTVQGRSTFDSVRLVERYQNDARATAVAYYCVDSSSTRLLDSNGDDVTPSGRRERTPLTGTFVSREAASPDLVLSEVTAWDGSDFCSP